MTTWIANGSGHDQSLIKPQSPTKNIQITPKTLTPNQTDPPKGSGSESGSGIWPEMSGRERLKRHRAEMAGRVWIPDVWGQEELLKDWADNCNSFDAMRNSSLASARAALVQEGRMRAYLSGQRIGNSC